MGNSLCSASAWGRCRQHWCWQMASDCAGGRRSLLCFLGSAAMPTCSVAFKHISCRLA
jgi:hypothetical protein